mmetsp:Transcript_14190/g.32984  ORF Transcript_14190/g.32984 Transcript_14190/m.32984 type:complete len:407 (+) Transcript_14190:134-1354(+)|eukprot:CAMPEP_0182573804 /NCGR_PEP_ID=MMETSP1324-20130603/20429_1 /TAXON_ID=236786 /ORGANISM="Florenciella sp., Strain RCC1587" /LENGTH=406 /DNA_ID=CAMNT_0024788961 /DNA_START=79 /DNA_END=1296 /DNA_ORIENTATION=-
MAMAMNTGSGRMVRTAPAKSSRRTAMNPDRLTAFMDSSTKNMWSGQTFSSKSIKPQTIYDPSLSWDGLSVNPKPFSRLDQTPEINACTLTAPIGMAGARVVELSDGLPDGLFEGVTKGGEGIQVVPRTLIQNDVNFNHPEAPAAKMALDPQGDVMVMESGEGFMNMRSMPPRVTTVPQPPIVGSALDTSTGQLRRYLLTPKERSDLLKHEQKTQKANALQKTAELQQRRLVQIMRHRHREGAVGVDGVNSAAESGSLYEDRAAVKNAAESRRMRKAGDRRSKLATVAFAQNRYGHNPFHHNEEFLGPQETKFMQTKGGSGRPGLNTQSRLFGAQQHVERAERTQHLRDEDLSGKNYNLTGHHNVQYAPSVVPQRVSEKSYMKHPSQQLLERGRNMQGSMPVDKLFY